MCNFERVFLNVFSMYIFFQQIPKFVHFLALTFFIWEKNQQLVLHDVSTYINHAHFYQVNQFVTKE